MERLPPLTALRAFDAAARHMSFADAAAELNVTPAALSHQIKSLEDHLGTQVFHRLNRAVELTEAGRALHPDVQTAFETLQSTWTRARRQATSQTLTVTAGPAFTAKWLAPRFYDFARRYPDMELRLSAGLRLMDFDRDEVDVAIRFGHGPDPGLYSEAILHECFTPMASPELAQHIKSPADLQNATLIHQEDLGFLQPPRNWPVWFKAMGMASPTSEGIKMTQADHALDAAVSGAGVVLGRVTLAAKDLIAGRLVMPFTQTLPTAAHYRFICAKHMSENPMITAFRDWIKDELQSVETLSQGRKFLDGTP